MGRDKASLLVAGKPMIAHVLSALSGVVDLRVVAAAPDQALPALPPDVLVVRDREPHRGPLIALEQAMAALPPDVRQVFVCGSDLPRLAPAVVDRMFTLATTELTVLERDGLQLMAAVYDTALRERMSGLIKSGQSSMRALAREAATRVVSVAELLADVRVVSDDPTLSSFDDVDSPADLPET
jgi:molybdopterin-guanine dinucleotide biosynthesis protein A